MDDRQLLALLCRDPEAGLRHLMACYGGLVQHIVKYRAGPWATREDLEECAAAVFFECYQSRDRIDFAKGSLRAFLSVIATRRGIDLNRRLRERQTEPLEEAAEPEPEVSREERAELLDAIESLGSPDREILIRRYYYGQSSREIGALLGLSPAAVDTRVHRSLKKLRLRLGGAADD